MSDTDVDLGFSMRMDENQPEADMPTDLFAIRPDTKGPKSIGVLLLLSALLLFGLAYGDISLHQAEDLSDEEVDLILSTPNSQGDGTEDISVEQYQKFHDAARESGGYALRGYGLGLAGIMLLIGGIMLLSLNGAGAKLAVGGATLGMASGISGSLLVKGAADTHLVGVLLLTYEITTYLCGVCMAMCIGLAALPLINARARLALYPENRVVLKTDNEE
ncbi:MAG: hypothetical protein NLN65_05005 [Candidatus Poseidoniaceae archaeon]|nr:hypothetical protein [Candidatus Poseidoniaceae archaeon]